ncbi:MAG: LysE family translocator [Burkholderiaceae bacterium]|nr:LysE family translocator [Burkholderiaceae bacterium]
MQTHTAIAFAAIAFLTILSPGPAVLLSLKNGASFGARSVMWSAFGNISGVFCLSCAAILGLGLMLQSSATLFAFVKLAGAGYLFYLGFKQFFSRGKGIGELPATAAGTAAPAAARLFAEAFLTAGTNPKALLFFTSLFPQFVDSAAPLMPQFFTLTGIFMAISYAVHIGYALFAARVARLMTQPGYAAWLNRVVGATFIGFGALLLSLRRQSS